MQCKDVNSEVMILPDQFVQVLEVHISVHVSKVPTHCQHNVVGPVVFGLKFCIVQELLHLLIPEIDH